MRAIRVVAGLRPRHMTSTVGLPLDVETDDLSLMARTADRP